MKRAFTLIEVVVVLSIIPIVLIALNGFIRAFVQDLSRGTAVINEQTTVLNMIDTISHDMDRAVGLPDSFGGRHSDSRTLLIALPTGIVVYEHADGRVARTILDADGRDDPNSQRQWRARDAVVDWQRWKQAEIAHAVEVRSCINQTVDGHPQKKLAQTRVFLLNACGNVREVE
jgi:prepilin-type N-terminal cleavage/methylation domain-containing protein